MKLTRTSLLACALGLMLLSFAASASVRQEGLPVSNDTCGLEQLGDGSEILELFSHSPRVPLSVNELDRSTYVQLIATHYRNFTFMGLGTEVSERMLRIAFGDFQRHWSLSLPEQRLAYELVNQGLAHLDRKNAARPSEVHLLIKPTPLQQKLFLEWVRQKNAAGRQTSSYLFTNRTAPVEVPAILAECSGLSVWQSPMPAEFPATELWQKDLNKTHSRDLWISGGWVQGNYTDALAQLIQLLLYREAAPAETRVHLAAPLIQVNETTSLGELIDRGTSIKDILEIANWWELVEDAARRSCPTLRVRHPAVQANQLGIIYRSSLHCPRTDKTVHIDLRNQLTL